MDARFSFSFTHIFFSFLTRTIALTVSQIFRRDLREIGWSDGKNVIGAMSCANRPTDRHPAMNTRPRTDKNPDKGFGKNPLLFNFK